TFPSSGFGAQAGIEAKIADGGGVDVHVAWPAASCTTSASGRIPCRSADGLAPSPFAPPRNRRAPLPPPLPPPPPPPPLPPLPPAPRSPPATSTAPARSSTAGPHR